MIVKVSSKGQIVLPAALRKKYGIDAGSDLSVVDMGGSIHLVPLGDRDPVQELRGILKGAEGLSSKEFLAERRGERDQDEGELERWGR